MSNNKPRELIITKFYLLAWIFGLLSVLCVWKNWFVLAGILLIFFVSYSRADYRNPHVDNGNGSNGNDDDSGGLMI